MSTTESSKAANTNDVLVQKEVVVNASVERAFDVFTKQMGTWWPLVSHHIGKVDAKDAVIEPRVGGRWFERGSDGSECEWGRVLAWDPPGRVVLAWQITADWQFDGALHTEVEVRFAPAEGGKGTRVTLEHRLLQAYGPRAQEMRGVFDSEGGWTGLLGAYAATASRQ
ncbi:MAG: SRPBCC family protein [Deltaproteobacteria bacterium]|nr:SRPBCC family protein [Deltaproteobacteria bacterium]